VSLLLGKGAVLDTLWDDVHLSRTERDVALSHLDGELPLDDEEEVIGVFVPMPDELAFDLCEHEVVTVELTDDTRLPVFRERSQLVRDIDWVHGKSLPLLPRAGIVGAISGLFNPTPKKARCNNFDA
jgi:hypothetical protein